MGGIGRTGLLLALVLKAAGYTDPLLEVRARFKSHAVETSDQKDYLDKFDVSSIQKNVRWMIVKKRFGLL